MKPKVLFISSLALSCILTGCAEGPLKTSEGIHRKLVIRKNNTALYSSAQLSSQAKKGNQWEVFFIYGDNSSYYKITDSIEEKPVLYYVKKSDVFEWNSYFCLSFKNSPDQTGREPIKYYETLQGLKSQGKVKMVEKRRHSGVFYPQDCQPVLETVEKSNNGSIYRIASLYDDIVDAEKEIYEFRGNYDFGYVRYSAQAHQYYRYVKKDDFQEHVKKVLASRGIAGKNMNPGELDQIYSFLASLFSSSDGSSLAKGVKEFENLLTGKDIPVEPGEQGVFEEKYRKGQDTDKLDKELRQMYEKMVNHLEDNSNWNKSGYSFILLEWMK